MNAERRMHTRRAVVPVVIVLAALGLASCSTSPSSSPSSTTAGAAPSTTGVSTSTATAGPTGPSTTARLCSDLTAFEQQEQDLTAVAPSDAVSTLQAVAAQAKAAFVRGGPRITDDLATAPEIVQTAWSTIQPQFDQVIEAAATATSLPAFIRAIAPIESSNTYTGANQTLSAYASAVCPNGTTTADG